MFQNETGDPYKAPYGIHVLVDGFNSAFELIEREEMVREGQLQSYGVYRGGFVKDVCQRSCKADGGLHVQYPRH